jgi:thioesterase domain-containing protein
MLDLRTRRAEASLVPIVASGWRAPMFWAPPVSGSAGAYVGLRGVLGRERPAFALEAPGLEDDCEPVDRLEGLAAAYVDAVRQRQPAGPHILLGWSMGGLVAFEMARQLSAAGDAAALLVLIDSALTDGTWVPGEEEIAARFAYETRVLEAADVDEELMRSRLAVFRANVRALYSYRTDWTFPGRLVLIRAAASPSRRSDWAPRAHQVEERTLPGDHHSLLRADRLPALASAVEHCLPSG